MVVDDGSVMALALASMEQEHLLEVGQDIQVFKRIVSFSNVWEALAEGVAVSGCFCINQCLATLPHPPAPNTHTDIVFV